MLAGSADVEETRRIVLSHLGGVRARVYLSGSWASGAASRTSDIDVAIEPLEPLPPGLLAEIHEALEDSHILRHVDLVDLSRTGTEFGERVRAEGIPWTG